VFVGGSTASSQHTQHMGIQGVVCFFPFYVTIRVKKCIFLFAKLGAVPLALVLASRSDDTCVVDVCRKLQDLCCDGESSNPISFILITLTWKTWSCSLLFTSLESSELSISQDAAEIQSVWFGFRGR
jgi:hypothetical protein